MRSYHNNCKHQHVLQLLTNHETIKTMTAKIETLKRSTNLSYQQRLQRLTTELNSLFLERKPLIKLMLVGLIGKLNGFLGGPPGTGKTALTKAVTNAFGGHSFYYLMNPTTTVDEIIGELDLESLQQGNGFQRNLSGKLADCNTAILDEGFKSNSACLNSLLGIILDKQIVNGPTTVQCPLISLWVCSNELPEAEENLAAFWDRLTLRYWVNDLSPNCDRVLMMRRARLDYFPDITTKFTLDELEDMQIEASRINWEPTIIDVVLSICNKFTEETGTRISTRKKEQIIDTLGCYAYVSGDNQVDDDHLEVLKHILWDEPKQQSAIASCLKEFGNPVSEQATSILAAAKEAFTSIDNPTLTNRGDWMRQVGVVDTQLTEMQTTLNNLIAATPKKKKLRKVNQTLTEITKMQQEIQGLIQKAYGIN